MTDKNVSICQYHVRSSWLCERYRKPLMHHSRRVDSIQAIALQFSIQGALADIQRRGNLPAIIVILAQQIGYVLRLGIMQGCLVFFLDG